MPPTLIDIARETETSVSTVSRVLAGGAGASRISEPTRKRVLEVAARMGYRPNLVARSLRTRRSQTVALLVPDIANPWFGEIASLVEQSLHRHGYSLILCNSGEDAEREEEYLRLLPAKGIDGLILVPQAETRKDLMSLLPPNLPLVILDRPVEGITASVASDQQQSATLLCDALQNVGVKRVALVCGPQHVVTHRRRAELVAACFEVVGRYEGPAQRQTGQQAYAEFAEQQPDAFVCTNNFLGAGVVDGMSQANRPALVGSFEEIPMMQLLPIPIVCAVQNVPLLAEGCVQQLLPQLRGERAELEPLVLAARMVTNPEFELWQEKSER